MSEPGRRRVVVQGHVQGVFFRNTIRREAERRGVAGWVRNRRDGAVESVFEGSQDDLDAMVELSRRGPRGARVERVEVEEVPPEGLSGFEVR